MKDRIRQNRCAIGMTQAELANQMGYNTPSIVAMWESGDRKPPSDKLPKLAAILGCTIDELYEEEKE